MLSNETDAATQELLDLLIDALIRDEDWRGLVTGPLDPEVARLMAIAESIHHAAATHPKPDRRQRLRIWDRVFHRGQAGGEHGPAEGLLSIRRIAVERQLALSRRLGAIGMAPGHLLRARRWL